MSQLTRCFGIYVSLYIILHSIYTLILKNKLTLKSSNVGLYNIDSNEISHLGAGVMQKISDYKTIEHDRDLKNLKIFMLNHKNELQSELKKNNLGSIVNILEFDNTSSKYRIVVLTILDNHTHSSLNEILLTSDIKLIRYKSVSPNPTYLKDIDVVYKSGDLKNKINYNTHNEPSVSKHTHQFLDTLDCYLPSTPPYTELGKFLKFSNKDFILTDDNSWCFYKDYLSQTIVCLDPNTDKIITENTPNTPYEKI